MKSIINSIARVFNAATVVEPTPVHTVHVVNPDGSTEGVIYIPLEKLDMVKSYGFSESELSKMLMLKIEPFGEDHSKIWLETMRRDRKLIGVIDEHGMFTFRTSVKNNFTH